MRPFKRTLWLTLALALVAVASIALVWNTSHKVPPQIITLASGDRYQFAGVTYGTRVEAPIFAARLARMLPAKWVPKSVRTNISQFNAGQTFDSPRLLLWFRQLGAANPANVTNLVARLSDESGVEAGTTTYPAFAGSITWSFADFPVIPRRSRMLKCTFYPFFVGQPPVAIAQVTFPNPAFGRFPQWKPEPVPALKTTGDVEVRLDDLATGRQTNPATVLKPNGCWGVSIGPAAKGQDTLTGIDVTLTSAKGTDEFWVPQDAELSDATGNVLRTSFMTPEMFIPNGHLVRQRKPAAGYSETIRDTLWPDEGAWRLKLQVKRAFGFASNEVLAFTNVTVPAVGTTNVLHIVKGTGPSQIVLTKFIRRPDAKFTLTDGPLGNLTEIYFDFPSNHAGMAYDLQSFTGDTSGFGRSGYESGSGCVLVLPSIPTNAQTMDITWVAQKTRSVEFMVAPPKRE